MKKVINQAQKLELDHILRSVKDTLNFENLHPFQQKAFTDLTACRTSALGGHRAECNNCHHYRNAYNSCRNRHCPKCQLLKKVVWVDKLKGNLPAVKHFFTPEEASISSALLSLTSEKPISRKPTWTSVDCKVFHFANQ